MSVEDSSNAGDHDAGTLDRFRSYLYVLARSHVGANLQRRIDASDIVQQTMLEAFADRSQFRGQSDAERAGWLRRILARNVADAVRHEHRGKRDLAREHSLDASINESFRAADAWLAAKQSSPSERAVAGEEILRMTDALTELPAAQRDAIILRHLQGLPLARVAEELGKSEPSTAGLLFRGLKRLNQLLTSQDSS